MTRTRRKPTDPAVALARRRAADFHATGQAPDTAALTTAAEIEVRSPKTGARRLAAQRMDAFGALRDTMSSAMYQAAMRYQLDIIQRKGEGDRGRSLERVDCEGRGDRTDAIIKAGERVEAVRRFITDRQYWLLTELASPSDAIRLQYSTWRDIGYYITGEHDVRALAAVIRGAVKDLLAGYTAIDNGIGRGKAA